MWLPLSILSQNVIYTLKNREKYDILSEILRNSREIQNWRF